MWSLITIVVGCGLLTFLGRLRTNAGDSETKQMRLSRLKHCFSDATGYQQIALSQDGKDGRAPLQTGSLSAYFDGLLLFVYNHTW